MLSGLFKGNADKKTVIGLDIGSYAVKAVALQPNKGRLTLQGYAQMRIGESDQALVVRQVIEQLGMKPRTLVSAVSGRSVIVRQVSTPTLSGDDLKQHIAIEADKYIPFGTDEVIIDCQPMPNPTLNQDSSEQEVLLVAVRRNSIEEHVATLQAAGVQPSIVDVDVFALVNAFQVLGPVVDQQLGADAPEAASTPVPSAHATALIDIGASKSWVAIVKDGRLLFQREIYLAGNDITDSIMRTFSESVEEIEDAKQDPGETLEALLDAATPALEDLANEIRLSFDYVEGQKDEIVERVVLTGASCQLPQLADILGNILDRPVQVFDPLSGVDLVPSKYDLHGLDANAPSLTVALGLACHELSEDLQGLGGLQVASWNSGHSTTRSSSPATASGANTAVDTRPPPPEPARDSGMRVAPPPPAADYEPSPNEVSPLPGPTPSPMSVPIDMPTDNDPIDLASLEASMPPIEESDIQPMISTPPPAVSDIPPPAASDIPPPPSDVPPVAVQTDRYTGARSSMLVVLDDDEYTTSHYRRTLSSAQGQSSADVDAGVAFPDADLPEDDDLPPLPS